MELAFLQTVKQVVFLETVEYFTDMFSMVVHVVGVDQDVI